MARIRRLRCRFILSLVSFDVFVFGFALLLFVVSVLVF